MAQEEKETNARLNNMFREIVPILQKHGFYDGDSNIMLKTDNLQANFDPNCNFAIGCHYQLVDDGNGGLVRECICPGDPRYIPD